MLAYEAIRSDIISGAYKPGERIKIQDIAEDLQISAYAVRAALHA